MIKEDQSNLRILFITVKVIIIDFDKVYHIDIYYFTLLSTKYILLELSSLHITHAYQAGANSDLIRSSDSDTFMHEVIKAKQHVPTGQKLNLTCN